jgi:hypothetical protein
MPGEYNSPTAFFKGVNIGSQGKISGNSMILSSLGSGVLDPQAAKLILINTINIKNAKYLRLFISHPFDR